MDVIQDGNTTSVRIAGAGDLPLTNAQNGEVITGATATVDSLEDSTGQTPPGLTFPISFLESPAGFYFATIPATTIQPGVRYQIKATLTDQSGAIAHYQCDLSGSLRC